MNATLQHRIGQLVIGTISSPTDAMEARAYADDFENILMRVNHQIVVFTDLTQCTVVPQEAVEVHARLMRARNERFVRSALLLGQRGTFAMQVERMVRESGGDRRRAFWNRGEAEQWLGQVLYPAERESLFRYLHRPVGELAEALPPMLMLRNVFPQVQDL